MSFKYSQLAWVFSISCIFSCCCLAFDLYGHRGARGLAPENTLPGFAIALKHNLDYVDMDVVMSKDGVMVLQHDLSLDPAITRDERGDWVVSRIPIKFLTLAELQAFDVGRINPRSVYATYFPDQEAMDGAHIPSLEQAIEYLNEQSGGKIKFQIEIKSDPVHSNDTFPPEELAQAVVAIIHKQAITDRVEVQSFDWRCLLEVQNLDARIPTAYLTNNNTEDTMHSSDPKIAGLWTAGYLLKDFNGSIPSMIKYLGGTLWDPQDITLTQDRLKDAHAQGLKVVTWSTPTTSGKDVTLDLVQQQIAMGVDGIITDRPDRVKLFKTG
ncbi:MAG: glycerophosphodiester phosphodiesterase family protein [Legionella sp.]